MLMQWAKWFIVWNIFLYCKIIISCIDLFSATCFLYFADPISIQVFHQLRKKLKKRQHMTFMVTSSDDDKSNICQFFYQWNTLILNVEYVQKFMQNGQKFSDIQYVFLPRAYYLHPPSQDLRFSKKPNPGRVNENIMYMYSKSIQALNWKETNYLVQYPLQS